MQKLLILMGFIILLLILVKMFEFEFEQLKINMNLSQIEQNLCEIILGIMSLTLLLATVEIIKRLRADNLSNLMKAVKGTIKFRRFLKQAQKTESDVVIRNFNCAVKKSNLDVTSNKLTLFVKLPYQAQAQKIMKEQEDLIKEHIANLYPTYIVSTFERDLKGLWLIGTHTGALASERKAKKHH